MSKEYRTLSQRATFELVEKKSRFIAIAAPVQTEAQALAILQNEKSKYPDARHHVYAYRVRENNLMRYSDDGEPAKTAGVPVLDILLHGEIEDAICVVTRYFGGTLLGTGGLVRAYSGAAQGAVEAAIPATMRPATVAKLIIDYPLLARIENELTGKGAVILSTEYTDKVEILFQIVSSDYESLCAALTEATAGKCTPTVVEEVYKPFV